MSNTSATQTMTETYWDKYGIPRVSLTEALWQIELSLTQNQTRGVWCLISEAGEGKSQGIHGIARKHGRRVVDVRTAQLTHIGAGVPQRADEDGHFKIAVPDDFPRKGEKAILFFDEFNQGQPHAIALVFKMLEDRGMYGYRLPDDCLVVIGMNPSTSGYNVTKIEGNHAINRRVKKLYVYNEYGAWKKHAQSDDFHHSDGLKKPCHPWVIKFLNTTPQMLYTVKDRDGNKQFACPATWQTVSLDLHNLEEAGVPLTDDRVVTRLAASINSVNAEQLVSYIRNNEVRIAPDEILNKYKKGSRLRDRVLQLQKEAGGDFPRLVETVALTIFNDKPAPDDIAEQLVQFWHDMPPELGQAFYQQLGAAAKDGTGGTSKDNIAYMTKLTIALQSSPLWDEINEAINSAHDSFERGLKGQAKTKDPMK
jgi:hypothetical protein